LPKEGLTGRSLERPENELIFLIPFQDKLHGAVAEVADAVKQDDFFISRDGHGIGYLLCNKRRVK